MLIINVVSPVAAVAPLAFPCCVTIHPQTVLDSLDFQQESPHDDRDAHAGQPARIPLFIIDRSGGRICQFQAWRETAKEQEQEYAIDHPTDTPSSPTTSPKTNHFVNRRGINQ